MKSKNRNQSIYVPAEMIEQIQEEAKRLDRSFSWVIQHCVQLSLERIKELPSVLSNLDD